VYVNQEIEIKYSEASNLP